MLAAIEFGPIAFEHTKIILATVVGFAIFAWIVWKMPPTIPLGVPFLRAALTERTTRIEENQTQVDRALADVKQLRDDYASRLQRIEAESRQRIDAAVQEAETARGEIIAEAQQAAYALVRRSEEELARERTKSRIQLRQEIVKMTLDAAESAIGEHSSDKVQRYLIQDFIASVSGNGAGNGSAATVPPVAATPPAPAVVTAEGKEA